MTAELFRKDEHQDTNDLWARKRALQARCFDLMESGARTQESFLWFAELGRNATVTYGDEDFDKPKEAP